MRHIVLAGPTASGKTELALALARAAGAQIISADSRQVYRHLCAGTAKPRGAWQDGRFITDGVPYHLVDFLAPQDVFNAAAFCRKTNELLAQYPAQPFIFAGGTGMYLHAFFVGLDPLPPADAALRQELGDYAAAHGKEALHARLAQKDPASAAQIPAGNIQRVMRALEITMLTGRPVSALKSGRFFGRFPQEKALLVCLDWDKEILNRRIAARTQAVFDAMCAETQALLETGADKHCPALRSLGYPQIIDFLEGNLSRAQAQERIITLTRQYAKRQRTWFNRYANALRLPLRTEADFDPAALAAYVWAAAQAPLSD